MCIFIHTIIYIFKINYLLEFLFKTKINFYRKTENEIIIT